MTDPKVEYSGVGVQIARLLYANSFLVSFCPEMLFSIIHVFFANFGRNSH